MTARGRWRTAALALAALAAACSDINGADGVIALELRVPPAAARNLEVGETAEVAAWGIDAAGDSVELPITWRTPDTTVSVSDAGVVTALSPGSGRVQAQSGSLASELVSFTIRAAPDTLIVPEPNELDVAAGAAASDPLLPRLESFTPAGPVSGASITFAIIDPVFGDPAERTVELTGGTLETTTTTGALGTPTAQIRVERVAGQTAPATVVVEVTAQRKNGEPVPGSGQQFIVRFQ